MTFCETSHFYGKSSVKFLIHPLHGLRHNFVIDQSATENKVIHTLIIDFFSHGLRSVKIEQELEKLKYLDVDSILHIDCKHENIGTNDNDLIKTDSK